MKKILIANAAAGLILLSILCYAPVFGQSGPKYSAQVEGLINLVENNLSGPTLIENLPKWNLRERMAYFKVNGLSIAVVHDYKIQWARAYGSADTAEHRPVSVGTLFQAASLSKSLNAIGVLKLVQDKKLDLYADINNYLTSWKFPYDTVSKNKKITVANLLSHSAGLSIHGFPGYSKGQTLPTVTQILDGRPPANTKAVRSEFEPGLRFQYSGGGTTITQQIIMDITHQPYDVYMWENVLRPLGMTASSYTQPPPDNRQDLLATAYYENGQVVTGKYHIYPEEAPAGLWTNPTDLCKYIIETELSYQGKSAKVLSSEFTKLRLTPYDDSTAAFGVFIDKEGEEKYFQHNGANEGFRCLYYGSFDTGDGVAIMVNSDNGAILNEILNSVSVVYQWKDFYKPILKKQVSLPTTQLKTFGGKYQFQFEKGKEAFIQIRATDSTLILKQLWDGREIIFIPESSLDFFNPESTMTLKFTADASGKIVQMLAFGRDLWTKLKE